MQWLFRSLQCDSSSDHIRIAHTNWIELRWVLMLCTCDIFMWSIVYFIMYCIRNDPWIVVWNKSMNGKFFSCKWWVLFLNWITTRSGFCSDGWFSLSDAAPIRDCNQTLVTQTLLRADFVHRSRKLIRDWFVLACPFSFFQQRFSIFFL